MKKLFNTFFLLLFACAYMSAQKSITGKVIDSSGEPLLGANIIGVGTTVGTITDLDGSFSLNLPETVNEVEVSYIGFDTKIIDITGLSNIDITLAEGEVLSEVVVLGYNSVKRSDAVESISVVSADAIANLPITSIDNLLQGKSTGVEVTAINGKPGQTAYARVRGLTSINGNNDPLFIIDGVPMAREAYAAINPNDIQEMTILKDAAATAIYGSRGSAGVILVTTKGGSAKNAYVEYTAQVGAKTVLDDGFDLMNASEKLNYETALGVRSPMTASERAAILEYGHDWEQTLLRRGKLASHNLSFSGGTERATYFLSASRYDEQGISVGSDFDRTSGRFNGSYKITDWISVSNNISISRRNDNELRDRYNVQSPFVGLYSYNPYETAYNLDADGNIQYDAAGEPIYNFTHLGFNIIEAINNTPEEQNWTDVIGNIAFTLTPFKNFSFRTMGGLTNNTFKSTYFIKPGSILDFYVGDPDAPGIKRDRVDTRDRYIWNNVAQYDFDLSDRHGLTLLAGTEFVKDNFERLSLSGKGFPVGLSVQDVAAEITDGWTRKNEFSLFSLFGQLGYSFDNNFNIKGTIRRDGSSRFGRDNRYGVFYGVGLGYDLADLIADNGIFDQLKLRLSYGTTGNEPVSLYESIGVQDFNSYAGQTSAFPGSVANPLLQWETQKSLSGGIDFGILNNRISGSFELYQKKSTDLLFEDQLSRTTGFSNQPSNIGDMTNSGFDAEIVFSPIRQNDFNVDLGFRFSKNQTIMDVLNIDEGEQVNPDNSFSSVLKEGEIAHVWELVEYVGVDPMNGDLLYLDAEGNETNSPVASDAKILSGKSSLPTYWGGFDIDVRYKLLTLSSTFAFKGGNYIYNQKKRDLLQGADGARDNQSIEALDYWKEPGDITDIPSPYVEVEPTPSTRFLEKGDYVRLRNVALSLAVPKNVIDELNIQNISVFVAATNLLTWTKFTGDPEVGVFLEESVPTASTLVTQLPGEYAGFSYPNTSSITGGITVRF